MSKKLLANFVSHHCIIKTLISAGCQHSFLLNFTTVVDAADNIWQWSNGSSIIFVSMVSTQNELFFLNDTSAHYTSNNLAAGLQNSKVANIAEEEKNPTYHKMKISIYSLPWAFALCPCP